MTTRPVAKWARWAGWGACALLLGALACLVIAARLLGTTRFSVDSWSYLELAHTLGGPSPYLPNTIRSYALGPQAASFPFAYPLALAMAHSLFGSNPEAGVYLNILLLALTCALIMRLAWTWHVPVHISALLCLGLVTMPQVADDVLAARSLCMALACFFGAWTALTTSTSPWAGLAAGVLLGLGCETRFDFLPMSLAWAALWAWHARPSWTIAGALLAGLLMALAPWAAYSHAHFGKVWASDNSWVVMQAQPAHAMAYPVPGGATFNTDPDAWLHRVLHNYQETLLTLVHLLGSHAPVLVSLVLLVPSLLAPSQNAMRVLAASGMTWALVTVLPFALTGYLDERYFVPEMLMPLLACGLVLGRLHSRWPQVLLLLAVVAVLPTFVRHTVRNPWRDMALHHHQEAQQRTEVAHTAQLQKLHPGCRLTFPAGQHLFGARYGATTGQATALLPINLPGLNLRDQRAVQKILGPNVSLHTLTTEHDIACP